MACVLADEDEDGSEFYPPTFAIADPSSVYPGTKYALPGFLRDVPVLIMFEFRGYDHDQYLHMEHEGLVVRFGVFVPSLSPPRRMPYVGKKTSVLESYGKLDRAFVPIVPLDSLTMDKLYLDHRLVFVGVTTSFGPHAMAFKKTL